MHRHIRSGITAAALLLIASCADPASPSFIPPSTTSTTTTTTSTTTTTTTLPPMTTSTTHPAAPTTTVASAPTSNPCPYTALIHTIFGDAGDWATAIAWRESRCIANVQNSEGASGLMQLMLPLHAQLFIDTCGSVNWADPECNLRTAYALYRSSGTNPWRL